MSVTSSCSQTIVRGGEWETCCRDPSLYEEAVFIQGQMGGSAPLGPSDETPTD